MSTSPCCAGYKFPRHTPGGGSLASPEERVDYFAMAAPNINENMKKLTVTSPIAPTGSDYFAMGSMHQTPASMNFHSSQTHNHHHRSSSSTNSKSRFHAVGSNSISSLNSDCTLLGHPSASLLADFSTSSDTLVSDQMQPSTPKKHSKNSLLLTITLPKRSYQQPHTANILTNINEPLYEYDEDDWKQSRSAVNPFFDFNRNAPVSPEKSSPASIKPPSLKGSTSFPASSGSSGLQAPVMKKQTTMPDLGIKSDFIASIKSEQVKRLHFMPALQNYSESILSLSPHIKYASTDTIMALLSSCVIDEKTRLPNVLVIDIRSFADNVKSHIRGSLNVCLPLTLLKRANFNLQRCINSLPSYEKTIFQNYIHHNTQNKAKGITYTYPERGTYGLPPIFIYDNLNNSPNLYHMCKKLIDLSCWDSESCPPIYLLDESFETLQKLYPEFVCCGKQEDIDVNNLAVRPAPSNVTDPRLTRTPASHSGAFKRDTSHPKSNSISSGVLTQSGCELETPISNFKLPQNLPVSRFKIRHNEEVLDTSISPVNDSFTLSKLDEEEFSKLPYWLKRVERDNGFIDKEFNRLEQSEKNRLNGALSFNACGNELVTTPGGSIESCPQINCGLDYGHKNRYKDIFLFDHSRVRLNDFSKLKHSQQDSNYINASYLNPLPCASDIIGEEKANDVCFDNSMRYIATQGPLRETIGDFWKCVFNQGCLLIVSLSDEVENGVNKCSAFWRAGIYKSGETLIKIDLEMEQVKGNFVLRLFKITVDEDVHEVLQVHLAQWADMSTLAEPDDLLDLITLKKHILENVSLKPKYPTLTHCSAGCGRTGVFCTVDSVVSLVETNGNSYELKKSPIYEVVNNLRRQRISMVQTMRQYYFIYDTLVHHSLYGSRRSLLNLDIVKSFISRCNMSAL